jgi:hypothetical protein
MRENGTKRTAELTTTTAVFIHDTPSDVLEYHRLANAHRGYRLGMKLLEFEL